MDGWRDKAMLKKIIGASLILISWGWCSAQDDIQTGAYTDTTWTVTGYFGDAWFAKPDQIIGRSQEFFKGYAEGIFYSCNYNGQSKTYNTYTRDEFLENREFELFVETGVELNGHEIFVHRITCDGRHPSLRRVMYPFITQSGSRKGYYIFEGAIYVLEYSKGGNGEVSDTR